MEAACGYGQVHSLDGEIKFDVGIVLPIPHWCYPADLPFCDSNK
jgi:hypothetical protein